MNDHERKITPVTLNKVEKHMLQELSAASGTSMCEVVRLLILKETASRRLARQDAHGGSDAA